MVDIIFYCFLPNFVENATMNEKDLRERERKKRISLMIKKFIQWIIIVKITCEITSPCAVRI